MDYEGTRIRQGNPAVATVPTLAERNSGYTNFADLIGGQTGSRTDALGRVFPSGTIFDPATTRAAAGSYVRDPFPGNIIPASRLNADAIELLQLLPAPNGQNILSNYTTTPVFQDDTNGFDIRIDQVFSEHDQMFGRYSYSFLHRLHSGPFAGYADGGDSLVNSNLDDRSQNAVLGETHLFGPALVNELRIGLNREHALWLQPFGDVPGIPAQFGIQGIPQTPQNGGLPRFNVGTVSHFGSWGYLPSDKYGTTPQLTDDLTFTRGAHSLKTGFMAQRIMFPFAQPPQSRGFFSFSGLFTSVVNKTDGTTGIAQMLLNPTSSSNLAGANQVQLSNFHTHDLRRNYLGAYIQDDWKLTSRLTINLGIRWDYFAFMHDRFGDNANFIPGAGFSGGTLLIPSVRRDRLPQSYASVLASEGIQVQAGSLNIGQAQKTNFAPRIGIAYRLTPNLVLRAGYGIFYGGAEELGGGPLLTQNFPFEYTVTRTALTPKTPITADNSIGLLENSFQNLSINPATVNVAGIPLNGFEYHWNTPYTQSQNFMLQYKVGSGSTLSVGYVGSSSRHVPILLSSNPVLTLLPPGTNSTPYVPYPNTALAGGTYTTTQGSSNYQSLQTNFEKRFTNGLSLLANFTFAKILTNSRDPLEGAIGGYRAPYLPGFGIGQDYALADFDVRRSLHVSGTYELPFGPGRTFASQSHGLLAQVIGGWNVNWILTIQDGQPFTVGCPNATSTGFGCNALRITGQDPYAGSHDVSHFVNAGAFANPSAVTRIGQSDVGPLGGSATQVTGPPFRRFDFSLFKQFKTSETTYLEFRVESFNLTNTPNFANPSSLNFLDTTSFGRITSTRDNPNDPRQVQFGLKFYW